MAVSVQGYLALDLVKKNNVELVKGVDRASTTTVGALRTAVTVAQAMTKPAAGAGPDHGAQPDHQRHHRFDQHAPSGTDRADPRGRRRPPPSRSKTLQRAFQNIYDTMDEVDSFKIRALDSMKQTVTTLSAEVEKSKGYIARAEGQAQAQAKVAASEPSVAGAGQVMGDR